MLRTAPNMAQWGHLANFRVVFVRRERSERMLLLYSAYILNFASSIPPLTLCISFFRLCFYSSSTHGISCNKWEQFVLQKRLLQLQVKSLLKKMVGTSHRKPKKKQIAWKNPWSKPPDLFRLENPLGVSPPGVPRSPKRSTGKKWLDRWTWTPARSREGSKMGG